MLFELHEFAKAHNDGITGIFELGGAALNCLSIKRIYKAKKLTGIHWLPTGWFLFWGMWNVIFYPMYGLWAAFASGLLILVTNSVWLWLVFYYWVGDHLPDDPLDAPCEDAA